VNELIQLTDSKQSLNTQVSFLFLNMVKSRRSTRLKVSKKIDDCSVLSKKIKRDPKRLTLSETENDILEQDDIEETSSEVDDESKGTHSIQESCALRFEALNYDIEDSIPEILGTDSIQETCGVESETLNHEIEDSIPVNSETKNSQTDEILAETSIQPKVYAETSVIIADNNADSQVLDGDLHEQNIREKVQAEEVSNALDDQSSYTCKKMAEWMSSTEKLVEYTKWLKAMPWSGHGYAGTIIERVNYWTSKTLAVQKGFSELLSTQFAKDRTQQVELDKIFWLRSSYYERLFIPSFQIGTPILKYLEQLPDAFQQGDLSKQSSCLEALRDLTQIVPARVPVFPEPFPNHCWGRYQSFKNVLVKQILLDYSKRLFATEEFDNITIPALQESEENLGSSEAFFMLRSFYNALCEMDPSYEKFVESLKPMLGFCEHFEFIIDKWILQVKDYLKKEFIPVLNAKSG